MPASEEHHITVSRTARYHVLGTPASAREVWFVLHGYRQLAERFVRRFQALPGAGSTRAVVAPEALSRFYVEEEVGPHGPSSRVGASWMTRADRDHEIADYTEYLDRVAEAALDTTPERRAPPRLVVLGFSQGAETASRWVVRGRVRPAELVIWGGGLATDLDPAAAGDRLRPVRLRFALGSNDPWAARRVRESERLLRSLGLSASRLDYDGGHDIPPEPLRRHWPEPD